MWVQNIDLVSALTVLWTQPIQNLWVLPPNLPNSVNPPKLNANKNPRSNFNNLKRDPRIVKETPLAKKIRSCKFTDLIRDMNTKGHPLPTNAAAVPYCLS